jgi:hypothetical protein
MMSYAGAGLYDDDTGADVRRRYRELVADGATGVEATDALIDESAELLDDPDDAPIFWLALADTQSKVGRLEDRVRRHALELIASEADLARFAHDRRLYARRREVLARLAERLTGPQRSPVRIRQPFRSLSPVASGDIFWFALPSGRRILLRCVGVSGDDRDSYPTVELLDWDGDGAPPDPSSLPARAGGPNATGSWPDLLSLVRDPLDPDPARQIEVITRGAPITRRHISPSVMVPWTRLEEELPRFFGA